MSEVVAPGTGTSPLLPVERVASLLGGLSIRTIWRYRKEGRMPAPIKIRGTVRCGKT
jgi:predicted DNA-binding transcriptional regulator AlpA